MEENGLKLGTRKSIRKKCLKGEEKVCLREVKNENVNLEKLENVCVDQIKIENGDLEEKENEQNENVEGKNKVSYNDIPDRYPKYKYFCQQHLKERMWTLGAIKKFLGECDELWTKKKRLYPMKMWVKDRVFAAERMAEFRQWLERSKEKRAKQSERMKIVMKKKREEIVDTISNGSSTTSQG